MSDKLEHPLVPPRSEMFICEGLNNDQSFRMPSDEHGFSIYVPLRDAGIDLRHHIAAMACFEWRYSDVSQFRFEEYQPFLDFLKSRDLHVELLGMSERQECGDDFVEMVCLEWMLWSKGESWE